MSPCPPRSDGRRRRQLSRDGALSSVNAPCPRVRLLQDVLGEAALHTRTRTRTRYSTHTPSASASSRGAEHILPTALLRSRQLARGS